MKCVALRHVAFEDLGLFGPALQERGYAIEYVQAGLGGLTPLDWVSADLVVVLGGPIGVGDTDIYPWLTDEIDGIRRRLDSQRPLLGICLGAQLMAAALGARVAPLPRQEIGWAPLALTEAGAKSPLQHLAGLDVLHWHGDAFELPTDAVLLAATPLTPHQAFSIGRHALALQCHAEADATRIEPWLIGHTAELRAASIDIGQLRAWPGLQPDRQARAAGRLVHAWLDAAAG
jgi:GMP synthase (glutamine-hydrolysing)